MDCGYIRVGKTGPSEADQRAEIVAAGVDAGHLYVDDTRKPVSRGAADLHGRAALIRDIRSGCRILVTNLDRIGVSAQDIIATVATVMAAGAAVLDLATGMVYHGIEAEQLRRDAADAERRQKRGRMGKARSVLATLKIKSGPTPKLEGAAKEAAQADYRDLAQPIRSVAAKHGVSPSTLRRMFGERGIPPGRRKRAPSI